jgi:hypothetical protein
VVTFGEAVRPTQGKLHLEHEQIDAALTTASVFTMESKQLQLMTLYEQRLNRAIQKNLALLQQFQTARMAADETAMKEAAAFLKLSEMRGIEYSPSKDGFVFSNDQIHTAIDRQHRFHPLQTQKIPNPGSLTMIFSASFASWRETEFSRFHPTQIGLSHHRGYSWYHSLATGLARRRNTPPGPSVKHV